MSMLARDAIAQGCCCFRVRSYAGLMQMQGGRTCKAYLYQKSTPHCANVNGWETSELPGVGLLKQVGSS